MIHTRALRGLLPVLACHLAMFVTVAVRADDYHNVNGFFGERAAGLGGAYTAVSDDPSGAYYNPAGIAFAYDSYISLSASTYREFRKTYENVFGQGLGYTRASRTYLPNFFGAIKDLGGFKFAFSIVNPVTEAFDQADQIIAPQTGAAGKPLFNYRNDFTEDTVSVYAGPSVGYSFTKRMAVGATLYYTYDSSRISSSQLVQFQDGSYFQSVTHDRRRTMGLRPILGWQFMPDNRWSFGVSHRRQLVTAVSRSLTQVRSDNDDLTRSAIRVVESTENASAVVQGGAVVAGPPESGSVPEVDEWRLGMAFFASRYFMFTFDAIRTSGFRAEQDNTLVDRGQNLIVLRDSEIAYLSREPTLNVALGGEYYLTDNLSLRGGFFTNRANSREISWLESAIAVEARNAGRDTIALAQVGGAAFYYSPKALEALARFEHTDTLGISVGAAWGDAGSSISVTYVREWGRGTSQIDSGQYAQAMRVQSFAFYIVASTRN